MDSANQVLIIGAGIAGLTCAKRFMAEEIPFAIIEASDRIGGRIKTDHQFMNEYTEFGAEELHTSKSPLTKEIKKAGVKLKDFSSVKNVLYDKGTKQLDDCERLFKKYPDTKKIFHLLEEDFSPIDPKMSVHDFLHGYNVENIMHYFESVYGAEFGGTNKIMGARALGQCEQLFLDQFSTFGFINSNYGDILDRLFKNQYPRVQLKSVASKIHTTKDGVDVEINGTVSHFKYVVCTVPLTQLQKIQWEPQLSADKINIIKNHLTMNPGGKLFILTDTKVYDPTVCELFIASTPNIYFWQDPSPQRCQLNFLTGLIAGEAYDIIQTKGLDHYCKMLEAEFQEQVRVYGPNRQVKHQGQIREVSFRGLGQGALRGRLLQLSWDRVRVEDEARAQEGARGTSLLCR